MMEFEKELTAMLKAARAAAEVISSVYRGEYHVEYKADTSPVTTADLQSEKTILPILATLCPDVSVLSEESADSDSDARLTNPNGTFLVDPLDGTAEFVGRTGEFAVSVGFAREHKMAAGVIAIPEEKMLFYAVRGKGSYKIPFAEYDKGFAFGNGEKVHVSPRKKDVIVAVSRHYRDAETERLIAWNQEKIGEVVTVGSCIKGCRIAEGLCDVHYRFGARTKEWDTSAMQIIVEEAGAVFTNLDGVVEENNRKDYYNRRGFVILNQKESALILPEN